MQLDDQIHLPNRGRGEYLHGRLHPATNLHLCRPPLHPLAYPARSMGIPTSHADQHLLQSRSLVELDEVGSCIMEIKR